MKNIRAVADYDFLLPGYLRFVDGNVSDALPSRLPFLFLRFLDLVPT